MSFQELLSSLDPILDKLKSAFIALATKQGDRCLVAIKISEDLVSKGLFANEIIKEIESLISGRGGGKKDFAQAGGKDTSKIKDVLQKIQKIAIKKC